MKQHFPTFTFVIECFYKYVIKNSTLKETSLFLFVLIGGQLLVLAVVFNIICLMSHGHIIGIDGCYVTKAEKRLERIEEIREQRIIYGSIRKRDCR